MKVEAIPFENETMKEIEGVLNGLGSIPTWKRRVIDSFDYTFLHSFNKWNESSRAYSIEKFFTGYVMVHYYDMVMVHYYDMAALIPPSFIRREEE
jgi:hypothetical protein